jgi:hypothetical protein
MTSSPNGRSWRAASAVATTGGSPVLVAGPPALEVFNAELYCAVPSATAPNGLVYLTTLDGHVWSNTVPVPEATVSGTARVSLMAFNTALYWFLPGGPSGGPLVMNTVLD